MIILLCFYGFLVGISLGLSGAGGSILAVPLLVYGAAVPVHQAFVVSLIVVGASAAFGAMQQMRKGAVDFKAAFIMVFTSLFFAPWGAVVSRQLPGRWLMIGFALLMLIVGGSLWFRASKKENAYSAAGHQKDSRLLIFGGAITSFLNGLFGIGGGFLVVPTLVFGASMEMRKAMASSLFVIACMSLVSIFAHLMEKNVVEFSTTALFLSGGVIGVSLGVSIAGTLNDKVLQKGFSIAVFLVGLIILIKEFTLEN